MPILVMFCCILNHSPNLQINSSQYVLHLWSWIESTNKYLLRVPHVVEITCQRRLESSESLTSWTTKRTHSRDCQFVLAITEHAATTLHYYLSSVVLMASACGLCFSRNSTWVLRASMTGSSFPIETKPILPVLFKSCLEVAQHYFHCILLVKQSQASPDLKEKGREPRWPIRQSQEEHWEDWHTLSRFFKGRH